MRPNIHILGIQGSGKGTQSALLTEKYNLSYIASGDLFRNRSTVNDELGRSLKADIAAGKLMSDELIFEVVEDYLSTKDIPVGLLGDGVLRTLAQAEGLSAVWTRHTIDQPLLIHFQLSEEIALKRIEHRNEQLLAQGKEGRSDDNPEGIRRRFAQFHALTEPVIEHFEAMDRCVTISADATVEEIHSAVCAAVEKAYPNLHHVTN